MVFSISNTSANANSASDKSQWWFGLHLNEEKTMEMKFWSSDEQWVLRGGWRATLPVNCCLDEVVESEIHKDALRIYINNKIWKVTNESTRGKLNKKHSVPQVLYTDEHESWMVWETIPSRLKIRKEAREMQCFDHFLAERILVINYQLCRKDTLQDRLHLLLKNVEAGSFWKCKEVTMLWKEAQNSQFIGLRWDCMDQAFQMASPCKPDQLFSQLHFLQVKQYRNWRIQEWFFHTFLSNAQIDEFMKMAWGRNELCDQSNFHKAFTMLIMFVPCNATLKMAASWLTGKRTKGGRATLLNLQIVYNRWRLVLKERDWRRRRSQDEEPQHIHLEILPRNHDPSIHWTTYFFAYNEMNQILIFSWEGKHWKNWAKNI